MKTLSPFPLNKWLLSSSCKQIKPLDRLLALTLLSFRGAKSLRCNPSQSTLAKLTGTSRFTVWKSIQRLEDQGIIIPIQNGTSRSLHYFFTYDLTDANRVKYERRLIYSELDEAMKRLPDALKLSPDLSTHVDTS